MHLPEHVRVAVYQLLADVVCHIVYREAPHLVLYARMEHHLQQYVTQLLPQMHRIIPVDRLHDLVSLLNQIVADAVMILLDVPRATARRAQQLHDQHQIVKRVAPLLPGQQVVDFLLTACVLHIRYHVRFSFLF